MDFSLAISNTRQLEYAAAGLLVRGIEHQHSAQILTAYNPQSGHWDQIGHTMEKLISWKGSTWWTTMA